MTSNLIISLRSASKRSTIAALMCSVEPLHRHYHIKHSHFSTTEGGGQIHNFPTSVAAASLPRRPIEWLTGGFEVLCRRSFHGGGSAANFRASSPSSQALNAVADLSDEDKASSLPRPIGARNDDGLEISKLGISEQIVSALAKKGITKLFPIQKAVLEPAMQGRDMIGRARTGTGKTLAFGIPIMDKIIRFNEKHGLGRNPLALILAPTRELARQVEKEFYESAPNLVSLCVYGGSPIFNQISHLDKGADVVVGTPGRVIDLIKRGALNLSEVQFFVLDEADQMLNVGFQEAVESILENLPKNRQSLMFSATMPNWIRKLTENYLKDPLTIDLVGNSDQKLADGITLYAIASEMFEKSAIIGPLVTEHAKGGKCIVFTQTKRDADRLAYGLQKEFKCEALHGDIAQNQRERTLSGFRDGRFNVLVATDVAARGLDVPNVDLIIHYELPSTSEIFVHRSGRTGRAGKKGSAILVYSSNQMRDVKTIERDVGCKFVELPRISVEAGASNMFRDMGPGRFTSFGGGGGGGSRFGNSGFAHSGIYGGSGSGRSAGYGNQPSGRMGSFGESGSSRPGFGGSGSGPSGTGRLGGGLGGFNSSRPDNFSGHASGRSGGFGDKSSSDRSSGIGAGNSGRFGDLRSSQTSGDFSDSRSRYFDGLGDDKIGGEQNTGWKAF